MRPAGRALMLLELGWEISRFDSNFLENPESTGLCVRIKALDDLPQWIWVATCDFAREWQEAQEKENHDAIDKGETVMQDIREVVGGGTPKPMGEADKVGFRIRLDTLRHELEEERAKFREEYAIWKVSTDQRLRLLEGYLSRRVETDAVSMSKIEIDGVLYGVPLSVKQHIDALNEDCFRYEEVLQKMRSHLDSGNE